MNKVILPIIGILINILMYSFLSYDGEFGLLIVIALAVSIILGFISGLIIDGIKRRTIKIWTLILSITVLTGINFWIFPFAK